MKNGGGGGGGGGGARDEAKLYVFHSHRHVGKVEAGAV